MLKGAIKHTILVLRHKWYVFIFCSKIGMPIRGFKHDFSKFTPTEFLESIKYYKGTYSPITECKRQTGYSKAWLHHKGRNKHHPEYWYDSHATVQTPMIPYKYVAEMTALRSFVFYQMTIMWGDVPYFTKPFYLKYRLFNTISNNENDINKLSSSKNSYLQLLNKIIKMFNKIFNTEESINELLINLQIK